MIILGLFLVIPLAIIIFAYRVRRLQSEERLRAIEKGVAIPQLAEESATRSRRLGIILVAFGLGVFVLALALPEFNKIVMASSSIFILMGLGMLLEYRLSIRDLKTRNVPPQN